MVKRLVKRRRIHNKFIVHGLGTMLVILGTTIAIMVYSNQWHQQQYFFDNVQRPLVELQGIIEYQESNDWSEPELVSNQLHVIVASIEYGLQQHAFPSKALSRFEYTKLRELAAYMRSLPNHELYESAVWDEASIQRAEQLNASLKASNLKLRTTIEVSWEAFIKKIDRLTDELLIGTSGIKP